MTPEQRYIDHLNQLDVQIEKLSKQLEMLSKQSDQTRDLLIKVQKKAMHTVHKCLTWEKVLLNDRVIVADANEANPRYATVSGLPSATSFENYDERGNLGAVTTGMTPAECVSVAKHKKWPTVGHRKQHPNPAYHNTCFKTNVSQKAITAHMAAKGNTKDLNHTTYHSTLYHARDQAKLKEKQTELKQRKACSCAENFSPMSQDVHKALSAHLKNDADIAELRSKIADLNTQKAETQRKWDDTKQKDSGTPQSPDQAQLNKMNVRLAKQAQATEDGHKIMATSHAKQLTDTLDLNPASDKSTADESSKELGVVWRVVIAVTALVVIGLAIFMYNYQAK